MTTINEMLDLGLYEASIALSLAARGPVWIREAPRSDLGGFEVESVEDIFEELHWEFQLSELFEFRFFDAQGQLQNG